MLNLSALRKPELNLSALQPIREAEKAAGLVKTLALQVPGAILNAFNSFMASERERRTTTSFREQAFTELVERPAKILKAVGVDFPRLIAHGFSSVGKSVLEAVYTPIMGKEQVRQALKGDPKIEQVLFKGETKSWQNLKENIDDYVRQSPISNEWEKKNLGLTLAVAGFMADAYFPGGKGKLTSQALKELIEATTDDLARITMIRYGLPEELANRAARNVARARTAQEVETAIKGEAARLVKQADTPAIKAPTTPKTAPETAIDRFYVNEFNAKGNLAFILAEKAKPVDISPVIKTFISKGKVSGWRISEARTGTLIAEGKTQKEAIDKASQLIEKNKDNIEIAINKAVEKGGISPSFRTPTIAPKTELSTSISKAKASGQSFDEWVKGQKGYIGKDRLTGKDFNMVGEINKKPKFQKTENADFNKYSEEYYRDFDKKLKPQLLESAQKTFDSKDVRVVDVDMSGSYKRGTPNPESDLDVKVYYEGKVSEDVLAEKMETLWSDYGVHDVHIQKVSTRPQLKAEWDGVKVSPQSGKQTQTLRKDLKPDQPSALQSKVPPPAPKDVSFDPTISRLPAVVQGETFTLGTSKTTQPTIKAAKAELKATQKEIKNAQIAKEKAAKLETNKQKVRTEAMENIQRQRGDTERIVSTLKGKNLSEEDIANIVLEDGTKLADTVAVKRNADGSLSTIVTKKEIDDIAKSYTDEIPKQKWEKRSMLVEGLEVPINAAKSIELPYVYFERKGLTQLYDPIIQAGRDAEVMKNTFLERFKEAKLFKEGGWFTANRFTLSKEEAKGVAMYYLGRQGRTTPVPIESLSKQAQKFVEIFDGVIKETETSFFETAKRMGKTPGKVENYAPIMTSKDIKLSDEAGAMDWLFRNHPAFFSLKERAKKVPLELYELDYREVATRWLEGVTQFIHFGDTTNHLKYLINGEKFKSIVKENDWQTISNWLKDITTAELPSSAGGKALNMLSRLGRKGVAIGSLGLNYASVAKQALTQIPIAIINKSLPKLKGTYAKAFGIDVKVLPSITKRRGDIAIQDLQGKIGRIFTGALTEFDKKNAQVALNGLLDKEYAKFIGKGVEISPEIQKVIEKKAQDALDMWFGGFFKGQRPEAFRKELGNFILMFLYPLTSQLNGFYRHILQAKGATQTTIRTAEVLAAVAAIAYMEGVIENLSFEWSDEKGMTEDVLLSAAGNVPLVGNIAYSIINETEFNASPVIGNINTIIRNMGKGETGKTLFAIAETSGLPKQFRRIKEGMEILEEGGITDNEGKMLAPVQGTMELVRAFLRGKYGPIASQDWVRNIGEKTEDRRWFVPQVEFLQNGDYERKAELYKQFTPNEQKELRNFLSEAQQKKLDKALKGETEKTGQTLESIFGGQKGRTLENIFK